MIIKLKQIFNKLRFLNPFRKKPAPINQVSHILSDISDENVAHSILWQSLMLNDDECLVYKDEVGVIHYFTTQPIDPNKEYKILYLEP